MVDGPDIQRLLESLEATAPAGQLSADEVRPADVAAALGDLEEETQDLILSLLDDARAAFVLKETDEHTKALLVERIAPERFVRLLNEMAPDDAADVLALVPVDRHAHVMANLSDDLRRSVTSLEEYPSESAGGVMTTAAVAVGSNETVRSALIKAGSVDQPEAAGTVYVVDPAGTLVGVVSLKTLLTADLDGTVDQLMEGDVVSVSVLADQEEAARLADHYQLTCLPVVDNARRLKGVITADDLIDVLSEEASEDLLRLAGTSVTHPTTEPLMRRLIARAPWLSVTLVGSLAAGRILEYIQRTWFPESMAGMPSMYRALIYYIPLVGGMAGNVGSQSSATMVRGFATGEVDPRRPMRVLPNELALAIMIGVICGILVGFAIHALHPEFLWLGLIAGIALPCAIVMAAVTGTMIPFGCHLVSVDPAYASGPFLQMLNDLFAYVIYFSVAIGAMRFLGSV